MRLDRIEGVRRRVKVLFFRKILALSKDLAVDLVAACSSREGMDPVAYVGRIWACGSMYSGVVLPFNRRNLSGRS